MRANELFNSVKILDNMMKFICFLVLIPTLAFAQNNTQNIRGIVTDKLSQTPIIGASIQIISTQKGTTTDTLGKYTIYDVSPDRYSIRTDPIFVTDPDPEITPDIRIPFEELIVILAASVIVPPMVDKPNLDALALKF